MIKADRADTRWVQPRARVFGRPLPWAPAPAAAAGVPPGEIVAREARCHSAEAILIGAPKRASASLVHPGEAISISIGAFEAKALAGDPLPDKEPVGPRMGVTAPSGRSTSSGADLVLRLRAALQPPLSALLHPDGVLDWPAPLLPYQREGIASLLKRQELLLADDMGLGKTVQALAALRILFFRDEAETALVVCPASLVAQWRREAARWAPELVLVTVMGPAGERAALWRLPAHIKLISYDTLRGDVLDLRDSPATARPWSVVVLDEASRIKNRETGIAQACKLLPRIRRWALTGTPLENRLDDVVSLLGFLSGGAGRHAIPSSQAGEVRKMLREVQLRRKKEDVLVDLPPRQVIEQTIALLPAQREAYDRAERDGVYHLRRAGAALTITHVLELIMRLKQICNNDPRTGESAKMSDIEQRLTTLVEEGHRALIFSQFTDGVFGVEMAAGRLAQYSPLTYTGAHSGGQKAAIVDRFLQDSRYKALILSLRAGGVGLNLQAASYVFHLDRWWNPAIEEQADSRAHRMGQAYPVTVFRYICAGTIEERIDAKLRAKRQLFHDIVDDISLDLSSALTEREIFALFDLEPSR